MGQPRFNFRHLLGQLYAHRCQIERRVAGEIRNPETAADIQCFDRSGCVLGETVSQSERIGLGFRNRFCFQILRAAEDMETFEVKFGFPDSFQHCRYTVRIHAELLGAAAHFHARGFELEIRIHPDSYFCNDA